MSEMLARYMESERIAARNEASMRSLGAPWQRLLQRILLDWERE